ncbi:unnamed protein product [Psylliodes chrysocephalus]|uniref:Gag-like protein n=1 Tax=Psylliodes chrysocephalus TaxID=3402493 RepID=A0A9P0CI05_9CUCU|nr:unnamed protein product [Psylliodes chrysocephala]
MEEPDTNQDTNKNPYNAKTDENSQTSEQELSVTNTNANNQNMDNFNSEYVSIPSAEGLKITILNSDIPQKLRQNIMRYDFTSGAELSGDENIPPTLNQTVVEPILHHLAEQPEKLILPDKRITLPQALTTKPTTSNTPAAEEERTSPNSTFIFQRSKRSRRDNVNSIGLDKIESIPAENMEVQENTPPKISVNLRRVFKQKVTATLPKITLKNRYHALTDESEEEESDDSIEKRKQNAKKERRDSKKGGTETTNASKKKEEVQAKRKNNMPPIVLEGVPEDHKGLTGVLKDIIKGKFNVKYTNTSTIVFTEDRVDYDNVLANVKKEEMAYHTYTSKSDKSHAFVLRGLGDGTKIEDLEEDLMETYEIKIRAAYRMTTKNRPLFLEARKERRGSKKATVETAKEADNKKEGTQNKKKPTMPPIVLDGVPEDHKGLTGVLRELIKGKFNVKYTNSSTIVFTEEKSDYDSVLANVKREEMAYHTYTSKTDKSHAFVIRGLGDGTKIEDLEEDLMEEYEIKIRAAYRMTTKNRPLFLVVTDPSITLDYLNRNVRVVLYTRITWELRRSTKQIIQCHNCQAWGHATANCGRPSNCLKCAAGHHTKTCVKTRDTPAKCINCGGDHPANFTKCKAYVERITRMEERKQNSNKNQKQTYIPAPLPTKNRPSKLAEGTQTQHIEDDLVAEYDIKVRNIFRMNTKTALYI